MATTQHPPKHMGNGWKIRAQAVSAVFRQNQRNQLGFAMTAEQPTPILVSMVAVSAVRKPTRIDLAGQGLCSALIADRGIYESTNIYAAIPGMGALGAATQTNPR
jgi:hypothetical protein